MDIAKQISKEYADKNTCYANDSDLQYRATRKAVEYGYKQARERLMTEVIGGEVTYGKSLAVPSLGFVLDKEGLDFGDKLKLIIIKED